MCSPHCRKLQFDDATHRFDEPVSKMLETERADSGVRGRLNVSGEGVGPATEPTR